MEVTERKSERVPIMFEKDLVESIDNFSFDNRIRSRGAAVRLLVRKGLEAISETEKAPARS